MGLNERIEIMRKKERMNERKNRNDKSEFNKSTHTSALAKNKQLSPGLTN